MMVEREREREGRERKREKGDNLATNDSESG